METHLALGIGSFIAGWIGREWFIKAPEANTCNCHCAYSGPPVEEATWGSGNLVLVAVGVIGIILVCTNTAWAFKISFKDLASVKTRSYFLVSRVRAKEDLGSSEPAEDCNSPADGFTTWISGVY